MGERVTATFRISGQIKRSDTPRLVEIYNEYGMSTLCDEAAPAEDTIHEWFIGYEINYGNLEILERFCVDRGIDYEGTSECGSWGAGTMYRMRDGVNDSFVDAGENTPCIAIADLVTPEALSTGWGPLLQRIRRFLEPMPDVEIVDG